MTILGGEIMYKEGDKVRFIFDDRLGRLSNKEGTIVRMLDDDEVKIEGNYDGSKRVYEVHIPLFGSILVLDGFIKHIKE